VALNSYGAMEYEREESIGYITGEQAALQFFQKGVTAAFSIGFDGLMDGVVGSFKGFGILAEGLENLGKSIIKNNFNSWVNAFELDGKGGWDWNGEAYQESAWGSGALGMYASAFVTPMVQNKLDLKADGFLSDLKIDTDTLNRTAAGLIGETFDFAFSGEFNINVLNLSDLTGGNLHGGLLELSFGKDGFKGKVSSGGVNTSFGTMISSIKGLQGWDISSKLDKTNLTDKQKVAMRGLASNGMSRSQELFNQILSGQTTITQAYRVAVGEIAKTTATADGKEIALNADDLNGYELGVILAHEAERNGLDDGLAGQKAETRRSVFAHSDHAAQVLKAYGNDALNGRMSQEAMIYAMMQNGDVSREDFEAYIDGTYDSSADFWKIVLKLDDEGNILGKEIIDDNRDGLYIEDFLIKDLAGLTKEEQIAYILGNEHIIDKSTQYQLEKSILMSSIGDDDIEKLNELISYRESNGLDVSNLKDYLKTMRNQFVEARYSLDSSTNFDPIFNPDPLDQVSLEQKIGVISQLDTRSVDNTIIDQEENLLRTSGLQMLNDNYFRSQTIFGEDLERRVGLFALVKYGPITQDSFEMLAQSTFYGGETLGYYVDTTVMQLGGDYTSNTPKARYESPNRNVYKREMGVQHYTDLSALEIYAKSFSLATGLYSDTPQPSAVSTFPSSAAYPGDAAISPQNQSLIEQSFQDRYTHIRLAVGNRYFENKKKLAHKQLVPPSPTLGQLNSARFPESGAGFLSNKTITGSEQVLTSASAAASALQYFADFYRARDKVVNRTGYQFYTYSINNQKYFTITQ
jgi:hypothetical protein